MEYSGEQFETSFELGHGLVFVLLPLDDKPSKMKQTATEIYKTKHGAKYNRNGVSFAFVFRRVTKTSTFHSVTHRWLWQDKSKQTVDTVQKYVTNITKGGNYIADISNWEEEMRKIDMNIRQYTMSRSVLRKYFGTHARFFSGLFNFYLNLPSIW